MIIYLKKYTPSWPLPSVENIIRHQSKTLEDRYGPQGLLCDQMACKRYKGQKTDEYCGHDSTHESRLKACVLKSIRRHFESLVRTMIDLS